MSSVTLDPIGISSPANWTNPSYAAPNDGGLCATNASGAGYIYFEFAPTALPAGATVNGIGVEVAAGDTPNTVLPAPGFGTFVRLEIQVSHDAGTTWSARALANVHHQIGIPLNSLGGASDLWGLAFTAASIGSGSLMVRARRPQDGDEAGFTRYLESIRATVWWTAAPQQANMAEETKVLKRVLIGPETTPGDVAAVCTYQVTSADIQFSPDAEFKEFRGQGFKLPIAHRNTDETASASLEGHPDYNEIGFWLASNFGKPVSDLVATGVYRHTFTLNERGSSDPRSYVVEYSQADASTVRVRRALLNSFGLSGSENRSDVGMSGSWFSLAVDPNASASGGVNEVQTITVTGTPTTLNFDYKGKKGSVVVAGLTAAAFQTALQALTTVGAGNLLVSGSGPYVVTAAAAFAGQPLERIEVSTTGGTGSATCVRTTPGGHIVLAPVPILPTEVSLFLADTFDTLAANKMTKDFAWDFSVSDRYGMSKFWGAAGFGATPEKGDTTVGLKLTVAADAVANALIANWRAGQRKHAAVEAVGPIIASGEAYRLRVEVSAEVNSSEPYGDVEGTVAYGVTLGATTDLALGRSVRVVLTNRVASY
ncbi:hypothetical protein EON81_04255 [bacterium]|nr:MAG: hypothetical protein EON81_04255 [bacterium]